MLCINPVGIKWKEQPIDELFAAFMEMTEVTGGVADSSANPAYSMKKVAGASENYCLLYYAPKDYKKDGKFKEIEVKVKKKAIESHIVLDILQIKLLKV